MADLGYSSDDRDPLSLGHPETRPAETCCVIQRTAAVDEAEDALRFSLIALIADASRDLAAADVARAVRAARGVEEGAFTIVPFFPDHFLIHCRSQAVRDRILGASAIPAMGTFLVLRPWTRLTHANAAAFKCRVSIELEGVPSHTWERRHRCQAVSCFLLGAMR